MADLKIELSGNKKVFFASDFHLGLLVSTKEREEAREKKIISWLNSIEEEAQTLFLVGDIFDFWFEYKHAIPKGFTRFFGKIASMVDNGIEVYFFTGNHDLWMFKYLQSELGITIYYDPIELKINNTKLYVGHGDGLGPGDNYYKFLKKIFTNPVAHWMFKWLHPDIGIGFAKRWSRHSRISKGEPDETYLGDKEYLIQFCKSKESENHHDYYIFGHRHLPLEVDINNTSKYFNLGEWVKSCTYGVFDGISFQLKTYEQEL
jgi:UDP-2,3-diacylglucosamine hydrolase